MLEQSSLLLQPWANSIPRELGRQQRTVTDSVGTTLGFVRRAPAHGPRWLRWLKGPRLRIVELPDSSLVFSLRWHWGWPADWQVLDADNRLVGTVRGRIVLDEFGHFLAALEPPDRTGPARILNLEGSELGECVMDSQGTRITFAASMENNPFAKMLLLAAVLVSQS
jgi:hypothetical protein